MRSGIIQSNIITIRKIFKPIAKIMAMALSVKEFLSNYTKMADPTLKLEQIKKLFKELDGENKGYLDASCFRKKLPPIFHDKNLEMASKTLNELDNSKDGKVTFEEFQEFVERRDKQLRQLFEGVSKRGDPIELEKLIKSFERAGYYC